MKHVVPPVGILGNMSPHPPQSPPLVPSNFAVKLSTLKVKAWTLLLCENRVILTSVLLSQYTRVPDRQHIMTIAEHCNEITRFG